MTNEDRPPLAQRLDAVTRKAPNRKDGPNHIALRRVRVDAAKTILMLQGHADRAKFRNRETDEAQHILEAVLKRKAELAALDRDNDK